MKYQYLIRKSSEILAQSSIPNTKLSLQLFTDGAFWMAQYLELLNPHQEVNLPNRSFELYGYLKYSLCIFFSVILLVKTCFWYLPISIAIFYLVEVHFLFLFPLLIDNTKNPLKKSCEILYQLGVFSTVLLVMRIGIFMLIGLLNYQKPLQNWHIGCLAVIVWYHEEVRNRL